jgi:hypothetical protein
MPRVLVAGRVPARHLARIASIVLACGGQILDGQPGSGAERDVADEEPAFDFGA